MSVRCGVDLVEVERIEQALAREGESFRKRVYTPEEAQYCETRGRGKFRSYAARFAAKEAAAKALGMGIREGVSWNEIEVRVDHQGQPELRFYGQTRERVKKLGVTGCSVSLSHCEHYAMAMVVMDFK
ncbi:MAG: holo-ACP synthase [Bacillota bacterium]|nr:holo-ACP synthase [Bacillota bacterium]